MRQFSIRKGNYKGEHTVYDSLEEAKSNGVVATKHWYEPSIQIGEWVIADDGYIVQCLHRTRIINKNHKSGQYTDIFRFPQGTFGVYYNRDGVRSPNTKNFYGAVTNGNRTSMGNTPSIGRYLTIKKREFVTWMTLGYDPYTSYMKAFSPQNTNLNYITMQVNKLLVDDKIKEELVKLMEPFLKRLQAGIVERSGGKDLMDVFIDKTAQFCTMETKDIIKAKVQLEFMYKYLGESADVVQEKTTSRTMIEANYEVVRPPELGE